MSHSLQNQFLSIGFRPFYLGAAIFACLAMPLWMLVALNVVPAATGPAGSTPLLLPDLNWHRHEMLFGFAPAVIAGFLLTAVRNWTGLTTPAGGRLAALFGLWVAGRIANLPWFSGSGMGAGLAALVDLSFLPVLAVCLGIPLWRSRNRRNAFVLLILLGLAFANVLFHADRFGWFTVMPGPKAVTVAFDLIGILMIVIAGRVTPAFSANAIAGLEPRRWPLVEGLAIGIPVLILLVDLLASATDIWIDGYRWLLWLAGGTHLVRLLGWQPWRTINNPLLLALPAAYAWIPIHFLLRAWLDGAPGVIPPVATHALAVGAMGSLMLAMMTRSALGHTGRALRARSAELVCFGAIHVAALARVAGPLAVPEAHQWWLLIASAAWTVAFATFAIAYLPILTRVRLAST